MNNPLLDDPGFSQAMDIIIARYVRCADDVHHMTDALRMYISLITYSPDAHAVLFGIADESTGTP